MLNKIGIYKTLYFLIIFNVFFLSSRSQKFSFLEFESLSNLNSSSYFKPQMNFYSNSFKNGSNIGFYYFTLLNENWAQAYAGLIFKPSEWLSLSVGAGMEVNKNPYRFNVSMQIIKNKINFLQIYEYGGSGFWYNLIFNYKVHEQNSIGLILKRYYGLGLNYEHEFKNFPISFIISPLYDLEDESYKLLMMIRYYL